MLRDGCSRLRALRYVVFPISLPGVLTVVIFTFALVVNEYVYAITFISTSTERTISAGVPTELIRGDVFFWGSLMAATLLPAIPLALLYNVFLDRFIAGFTGGAFREPVFKTSDGRDVEPIARPLIERIRASYVTITFSMGGHFDIY